MNPRQFRRHKHHEQEKALSITVRKHLSADALIRTVRSSFEHVGETRKGKAQIPMEDALMAAFAMYYLKDSSLLQFDIRQTPGGGACQPQDHLQADHYPVRYPDAHDIGFGEPEELRSSHNTVLNALQRGKVFEKMRYLEEGYHLMSMDGRYYNCR